MKEAIAQKDAEDRVHYKYYNELDINTYSSFMNSDFSWACDSCLDKKKAIKGHPNLQNYCWDPHFAYFDSNKICRKCNVEFVFGKEEKKFWYESLKFWHSSEPVNCVNCRKDIRQYKTENKILSDILRKKEEDITLIELEKVVEIYMNWDLEEKAKYYQSMIKKRQKLKSKN